MSYIWISSCRFLAHASFTVEYYAVTIVVNILLIFHLGKELDFVVKSPFWH